MRKTHKGYQIVSVLSLLVACGGGTEEPTEHFDAVIRPNSVKATQLSGQSVDTSNILFNSDTLSATAGTGDAFVGSGSGLFAVSGSKLSEISADPISALTRFEEKIAVGTVNGLEVYDDSISTSPLSSLIPGMSVTALGRRNNELWIGSPDGLFRYRSGQLEQFIAGESVKNISTHDQSDYVSFETSTGFYGLKLSSESSDLLSLSDELTFERVTIANNSIYGLIAGRLLQRVELDADQAVWRTVAATTEENDVGLAGIDQFTTDASNGALWAVTADAIYQFGPKAGEVTKAERPTVAASIESIAADGTLFLKSGDTLHLFGAQAIEITYADIAEISAMSCNSCHQTLGTAPMALDSYEQWSTNIDTIIIRIENETMPPTGIPFSSTNLELIKEWQANGMPR